MAAAVAAASLAGLSACDDKEETNPTGPRVKTVPVRVAEVRLDTLRETVRGIGTLQVAETVEIKPEIDGLITEIHIAEGTVGVSPAKQRRRVQGSVCATAFKQCPSVTFRGRTAQEQWHTVSATRPGIAMPHPATFPKGV